MATAVSGVLYHITPALSLNPAVLGSLSALRDLSLGMRPGKLSFGIRAAPSGVRMFADLCTETRTAISRSSNAKCMPDNHELFGSSRESSLESRDSPQLGVGLEQQSGDVQEVGHTQKGSTAGSTTKTSPFNHFCHLILWPISRVQLGNVEPQPGDITARYSTFVADSEFGYKKMGFRVSGRGIALGFAKSHPASGGAFACGIGATGAMFACRN